MKKWKSIKNEKNEVIQNIYGENEIIVDYTYNEKGSMTSMIGSNGVWSKCYYDENNNCIKEEAHTGYWKTSIYNENNRCLEEHYNDGYWHKWKFTTLKNSNTLEEWEDKKGAWRKSEYNNDYLFWSENSYSKKRTIHNTKRFKIK
jgi:hypothetical protein